MRLPSYFAIILLGFCTLANSAYAQITPDADASIIRDFARVSFGHSEPLKLRSAAKGRQIRIRFDKAVKINPAPLLKKLQPYVISISQSDDGRSLLLSTNRDYRTRNFVSGNRTGIDIIGLQKGDSKEAPKAAPKVVEKKTPKELATPASKTPFRLSAIPQYKPRPPAVVDEIVSPEPAVPAIEVPTVEKIELVPQPTQAAAPIAPMEVTEGEVTPPVAVEVPVKIEVKPVVRGGVNDIQVEALEDDGIALTFPWGKRVAAAAMRRGNRTVIVFSEQKPFSSALASSSKAINNIQTAKIEGRAPAQIWVIDTPLQGVHVSKKDKSYHWRVELLKNKKLPEKLLRPQPQIDPPLKPHLFIPALQTAAPVKFYDPLVGDELTAIPFYDAGAAIVPARRFAEFEMPRTAQGVFIQNAIADLRIARTRAGLKITAPEGILISENLPPVQLPEAEIKDSAAADSYFPYESWIPPADELSAADFENKLWRQAADVDKKKRRIPRKRLAELYLAQGKAVEAKTVLQTLAKESPIYFTRNKLHAMLGGAYFLNYEYLQAETAFKHPTIAKDDELDFWRDILAVVLRGEGAADYQAYFDKYIRHYPPIMRQRLALAASDHYINLKKYNKALKIFDTLDKDSMIDEMKDHVQFLIARVLAGTTQKDAARLLWQKLSEKTNNRYIRPRALFAIANLNLAENKISLKEAIDQLEPLRIVWRGDQFEITLLSLLSRLYEEEKMYREALRAYREIVTYFPNHPDNLEITGKMADIFRELFNEGGASEMSPLQALSLYYEFRNLTPLGEEGDQMIQNLADRLIEVELLDRAAKLLQHQVEFRLSGEERSRVGARLALIHLLNRQPRSALDVLELTGFGGNPGDLEQQRRLLTARALLGLGESARANALLEADDSREAQLLRLAIHWKEREWAPLVVVAERLMGERDDPTKPLTDSEVDVLMKLSIGYVFEQQRGQLQYLSDYFLPLIEDGKSRELFNFITEDTELDYRNIAKFAAQIDRMESFLASYKTKIKEGGLSKAVE